MELSIIVAAYNVQEYIDNCLDSLHFQKFDDVEFLIIDDGSTDQTAEHIKKFIKEKKDNRFKYYYKKNGGQADARNFGIEKAIGNYIWFVDGDDYIYHDDNLLNKFVIKSEDRNLDMLIFNCMFGNSWPEKYANKIPLSLKTSDDVKNGIEILNRDDFSFSVWHMLFKREFLIHNCIKLKKNSDAEDLLFSVQCLLKAKRVMYDPQVGYIYEYRSNSITKTHKSKQVTKRINDVIEVTNQIDQKIKKLKLTNCNLANLLVSGYIAQALTAFATGYVNVPRLEMRKFFKGKKLNYKQKIKKIILLYMPHKIRQMLCKKILGM